MACINDIKRTKLKGLGYMGSMNDAEKAFWETFGTGGTFPDGTMSYRGRTGQTTQVADGVKTVFTVPHGLPSTPLYASLIGRNLNSGGEKFINWDATNLSVTYLIAPTSGNVVFNWIALIN